MMDKMKNLVRDKKRAKDLDGRKRLDSYHSTSSESNDFLIFHPDNEVEMSNGSCINIG